MLYVSAVAYHTSHQPTVEPLISSTGAVTTASTAASGCSSRAINSFAACSPIASLFWRTVVCWGLSVWVRGMPSYPARKMSLGMRSSCSRMASWAPK